ncbi:MAG: ribosome maturation factor RimP [Acidobacteriota bacterium]
MDVASRTEELIRGVIESEGLELVHVEYQPRGASSVLRIYIDKSGSLSLQDCQRISRHVSVLLDVEDFIPEHYLLEVSSPGLERPLFSESDYKRFIGREIRLVTIEKIESRRNFKGVIRDFSEGRLKLEASGHVYDIPFQIIKKANLVYRFE